MSVHQGQIVELIRLAVFRGVGFHASGGVPGLCQGLDCAGIAQIGGLLQLALCDDVVPLLLENPAEEQHAVGVAQ